MVETETQHPRGGLEPRYIAGRIDDLTLRDVVLLAGRLVAELGTTSEASGTTAAQTAATDPDRAARHCKYHHVIPISQGGALVQDDARLLCVPCHHLADRRAGARP